MSALWIKVGVGVIVLLIATAWIAIHEHDKQVARAAIANLEASLRSIEADAARYTAELEKENNKILLDLLLQEKKARESIDVRRKERKDESVDIAKRDKSYADWITAEHPSIVSERLRNRAANNNRSSSDNKTRPVGVVRSEDSEL